jgi:nucleotide-binding universal stress UspA family protein
MVEDERLARAAAGGRRRVVVGYNGTEDARTALLWGGAEAARRGAPLDVLFAANYPGMSADPLEPGALAADEEVTARGIREAREAFPELLVIGTTLVTSPTRALVEASAHAALVVTGSRGHGPVPRALLGSVAFSVAARAECPVVVVPHRGADPDDGPPRRVVVGTDGSAPAEAAVDFAADWALAESADLEVLTCTGDHPFDDVDPVALRAAARSTAGAAAERLRPDRPALRVTTRVEDCAAERALVDASADALMVVVGTRGRGAFTGLLLGSVSHAVIHGAECPVAVVGEGQESGLGPTDARRDG